MSDTNLAPDASPDAPAADGPAAVADINTKVAQKFQRSNIRPGSSNYVEPPKQLKDIAEAEALEPGTKFIDPNGVKRVKPWVTKADTFDADIQNVPEGEQFIDPTGKVRQKPVFEPLNFSSQTLYDMSVTDSEKRKSLEKYYPGSVKEDKEGLYVEDNGKLRRPGRGWPAVGGFAASAALPTGGAVIGALGAGVPGAMGGSILGQSLNDTILQLSGVYDRSPWDEGGTLLKAGAMGIAGQGVGRGIATMVPAAKAGVSSFGQMLPTAAAHFLGAGPELTAARQLAEKGETAGSGVLGKMGLSDPGTMVPPSAWAHESPHVQNLSEVFDPAFRTNQPLLKSATEHYEDSANKILDDLGVKREGSILKPEADVPTKQAGELLTQHAVDASAEADKKLADELARRQAEIEAGIPQKVAQREAVMKAAEESRAKAQGLLDQGFESIQKEAETARKLAGSGINTGDLWENIGQKFIAIRQGISERARYWYDRYDQMTGGATVSGERLGSTAQQMLDELPAEFKSRNPALVQKLSKLSGQYDEAGNLVKPPEDLTYGQVHELRNLFRGSADWHTLSSDFKNGTLKYFSKEIDNIIHDPNAPAHIQSAAKFLDMTDKWYGHNISVFEAQQIKAVMKGLEAGEAADPANLYKVLVKDGQTALTNRVREMVGPNLWAGVRAADVDTMMSAAKTLNPGEINGRAFAKEVLDRHKSGMLEAVHGKEASEKLIAQARAIEQLEGRLPIPANPGDTLTQIIARARLAADEAKAIGTKDPLTTLQKDVRRVANDLKREQSAARRNDPLGFLYNQSTGASYAVDKILKDEDLILAAAHRFGETSPEFNALRQVYVERVLRAGMQPGKALEGIGPEVQQLMFPGVTGEQMRMLAKEMDLLLDTKGLAGGGKMAGGMMAQNAVNNPITKIPGVSGVVKMVPGTNSAARSLRGKYYALVTQLMTSPSTLRWIEKGLTKGTPEEREAVRNILRAHLQKGAAMGAGAGEAAYQGSGE